MRKYISPILYMIMSLFWILYYSILGDNLPSKITFIAIMVYVIHGFCLIFWTAWIIRLYKKHKKERKLIDPEFREVLEYIAEKSKLHFGLNSEDIIHLKNAIKITTSNLAPLSKRSKAIYITLSIEDGFLVIDEHFVQGWRPETIEVSTEKLSLAKNGSIDDIVKSIKDKKKKVLDYGRAKEPISTNSV